MININTEELKTFAKYLKDNKQPTLDPKYFTETFQKNLEHNLTGVLSKGIIPDPKEMNKINVKKNRTTI